MDWPQKGAKGAKYLYNVLPTLGAVCGVPAPPKSDGLDLSAVLHGGGGRESLVFGYRDVQRALATRDWKMIVYPKVNQTQLFNLEADPYEIFNLASDPKRAATLTKLSSLLDKELTAAGDHQMTKSKQDAGGKHPN